MSLSKHTSRIYMDDYDVQGTMKVLADRITADPDMVQEATPFYLGAYITFQIIHEQTDVRDQSAFMGLFELKLMQENGIEPSANIMLG